MGPCVDVRVAVQATLAWVNSPGLAQGVSDNGLEIEIQQGMKQKQTNDAATVKISMFLAELLFLVQYLNNSLTRGAQVVRAWV